MRSSLAKRKRPSRPDHFQPMKHGEAAGSSKSAAFSYLIAASSIPLVSRASKALMPLIAQLVAT